MKAIESIGIKVSEDLKKNQINLYSVGENNNLSNQHPIFKALMKLEFEKAIREYLKEK
jgi:hypothetical protein